MTTMNGTAVSSPSQAVQGTTSSTLNGTTASAPQEAISSAIKNVSLEPKSVTGDQGSISNHSLRDLILADRYLRSANASKPANKKKVFKSLFQRISPPSSRG